MNALCFVSANVFDAASLDVWPRLTPSVTPVPLVYDPASRQVASIDPLGDRLSAAYDQAQSFGGEC